MFGTSRGAGSDGNYFVFLVMCNFYTINSNLHEISNWDEATFEPFDFSSSVGA